MPPCFDVYVLVKGGDLAATLARFVDVYVDVSDPGNPHFVAFMRTFVHGRPLGGDAESSAELRRDASADSSAFSLYLRATAHHEAIVTLTEEGHVVLGLGMDDPVNDPGVERAASVLMAQLLDEFDAVAGIGGAELPPPQSVAEWSDSCPTALCTGTP